MTKRIEADTLAAGLRLFHSGESAVIVTRRESYVLDNKGTLRGVVTQVEAREAAA